MAGEKTAIALALEESDASPLTIEQQMELLDLPDTPAVRNALEKRIGRPPGARNRRTVEMVKYLLSRYVSPLEFLAQTWSTPDEVLAAQLECKKLEARQERRLAAAMALPFVHQKMPIAVDVTNTKVVYLTIVEEADTGAGALESDDVVTIDAEIVEVANQQLKDET